MTRLLSIIVILGFTTPLFAQNLSGKWIGYFRNYNGLEEKIYPYEITISNNNGKEISATTLTRFPNQSTATATARGNYASNVHLLSLQETKFEQIHLDPNVQGCLMNNYLTYKKENNLETLQGTYVAKNVSNGTDCGMGTVYLERDIISAMSLSNNKLTRTINSKKLIVKKSVPNKDSSNVNTRLPNSKLNTQTTQSKIENIYTNTQDVITNNEVSSQQNKKANNQIVSTKLISNHEHRILPWVLISRENVLVKKIVTHSKIFSFDIFDNGTIDNDTITIYDNKILMLDQNRLSYKAVHFEINFNDLTKEHEIIVVANNLGAVPPNTASLVYKDAKQNEEVIINTDFTKNAKIIIVYEPPN